MNVVPVKGEIPTKMAWAIGLKDCEKINGGLLNEIFSYWI